MRKRGRRRSQYKRALAQGGGCVRVGDRGRSGRAAAVHPSAFAPSTWPPTGATPRNSGRPADEHGQGIMRRRADGPGR